MLTVLKYIALIGTVLHIHHLGGVLEACVAAGIPLAGVHRVPRLHGGRLGIYAVLWQQIIKRME